MEVYLGTILAFGFNFAPKDWGLCNGAHMSITQNQALYSLLGTIFGGDGKTSFGLPDLRGRVPCGMGHGSGLTNRAIGQGFGQEKAQLTTDTLAPHTHAIQEKTAGQTITVNALAGQANKLPPTGNYWARGYTGSAATQNYAASHDTTMASDAVQLSIANLTTDSVGNGQPFNIVQPTLAINFSIALQGLFPPHN